jgi:endonuclease/exonuclease/phosphatase family metal-dependent hydrolase
MCTVVTVLDPVLGPVRVMTTHLEFYSKPQRMAQAEALRALHVQYARRRPGAAGTQRDGSPFQSKVHTPHAILCGDFNLQPHEPEYAELTEGRMGQTLAMRRRACGTAGGCCAAIAPHQPTFLVHDRLAPRPGSDRLRLRVRQRRSPALKDSRAAGIAVDGATQASDHQPVLPCRRARPATSGLSEAAASGRRAFPRSSSARRYFGFAASSLAAFQNLSAWAFMGDASR